MKQAKEEELKLIHHYIAKVNQEIKKDFEEHKPIDNEALENFHNAKEMYDITSQMPVYPYNMKTVITFVTSVLIPVAVFFLERAADSLGL
jgi:hypothetical protein